MSVYDREETVFHLGQAFYSAGDEEGIPRTQADAEEASDPHIVYQKRTLGFSKRRQESLI